MEEGECYPVYIRMYAIVAAGCSYVCMYVFIYRNRPPRPHISAILHDRGRLATFIAESLVTQFWLWVVGVSCDLLSDGDCSVELDCWWYYFSYFGIYRVL